MHGYSHSAQNYLGIKRDGARDDNTCKYCQDGQDDAVHYHFHEGAPFSVVPMNIICYGTFLDYFLGSALGASHGIKYCGWTP